MMSGARLLFYKVMTPEGRVVFMYPCQSCGAAFFSREQLLNHLLWHNEVGFDRSGSLIYSAAAHGNPGPSVFGSPTAPQPPQYHPGSWFASRQFHPTGPVFGSPQQQPRTRFDGRPGPSQIPPPLPLGEPPSSNNLVGVKVERASPVDETMRATARTTSQFNAENVTDGQNVVADSNLPAELSSALLSHGFFAASVDDPEILISKSLMATAAII